MPPSATRASGSPAGTLAVGLAVLLGGVAPDPAAGQEFRLGRHVPGVRVAVGVDPYEITGSTAAQIMRQLQTAGRPAWIRYPRPLFTWTYDAEVIPTVLGDTSDQCRFTDFEIVLDFTVVFPRWTPPPAAEPELVDAWLAFQEGMEAQWDRERDEYLTRAEELLRRARGHQDHCPLLVRRFHNVVLDLMDRSRPLDGHTTPEPMVLWWPPSGYEDLLERRTAAAPEVDAASDEGPPDPGDADAAQRHDGRPAVDVRPGRPSPGATPAPDLEFAVQTDMRGSVPSGFVAGLLHQGKLEYLNAFGTHPGTGEALSLDTPLPIPAFTEVLLSTLAAALHDTDFLDLDAPVSRYLSDVSPRLGEVTMRQLLEHRAGLDNAPPRDSTLTWRQVVDELDDRALMTEPGVIPSYSSLSFPMAARVLERATGATLEEALQRTLLDPLQLRSTFFRAREEERLAARLPVTHVSAGDLLRFWSAWLDGSITGAGFDLLPDPSTPSLAPDGRAFRRGLWVDRPGATPRLSLVCATDQADAMVQVFPVTGSVLVVIGIDGWPRHTGMFMLDALGRTLRIGNEIFGPVPLAGVAGFGRRGRPCSRIGTTDAYRPVDFGPRADAGDWAGRYVNGDWFFALEEEDGLLVSPRPQGSPWHIHHFEGDTHFASVPPEEGRGVGFPFRLFRGPDGRRYVMLGQRAYLHDEDRPPR